ncbi:putative acetyltransferase (GNAT) family protein [Trypoxylus dichotomus]
MPVQNSSTSSASSTPHSLSQDEYHISTIDYRYHEGVIEFLRRFFFRDEPLNVSVRLLDQDTSTCPELEEYSVKTMKDGMSVMATSSFGQIIGVCLNGIIRRRNDGEKEDESSNPKFCKIIKFLQYIEKESDVFGKYPEISKILCVKILSVDRAWRGRGIAKELMDKTR